MLNIVYAYGFQMISLPNTHISAYFTTTANRDINSGFFKASADIDIC